MKFTFNLAIGIYIIGTLGHELYSYDLDYLYLSEEQSTINWLLMLVRDIGLMSAASLATIMSLSSYSKAKNKTKAKLFITASIAFCILQIGTTSYAHYMLTNNAISGSAVLLDNPDFLQTYEEKLSLNDKELTERIAYSNAIASSIYMDTGTIINVINLNGVIAPYCPTPEDEKNYAELTQAKALLKHTTKSLKYASMLWVALLFISVTIGVLLARRKSAYNELLQLSQ